MNPRPSPASSRLSVFARIFVLTVVACALSSQPAKNQEAPNPPPPPPVQQPAAAPSPSANFPGSSAATIRLKVNLVTVPVVVRDYSGRALGNLQKQNFQLFDERKQQQITQFTLEKSSADNFDPGATSKTLKRIVVIPEKFTALLFDDLHSTFDNLPQLQIAGSRFIADSLNRSERLAIFTTSGKVTLDFTDDRAKLEDALHRLKPNPLPGSQPESCPTMTYFAANQILDRHDTMTRDALVSEVMTSCGVKDPKTALVMVNDAAERVLRIGDMQTSQVLKTLADVIDRLNTLPGQRTIVLASPSFLISDRQHHEYEVVDRAVRAHVIISALDSRGVLTDENDQIADYNVLSEFADGTGGTFFRNNNNLLEGLRRIASPPEFVYQLGFSPENLQENGKFHQITVKIVGLNKVIVNARKGYFAPNHLADPKQQETDLITETLYSSAEIHDLPIKIQTQTVRDDKPPAKLNVLALVNLDDLPHHQTDGKNLNELRVVAAIFDHNGKYLGAIDRKVAVHWTDDKAGLKNATTFSFLLDPGTYLVRLIVRDSESQSLSAQATTVQIP
jgi:VWFA-related protein